METITKTNKFTLGAILKAKEPIIYREPKFLKEDIANNYVSGGIYKSEAQNIMAEYIGKSNVIGLILSLPFIYCIIEKMILKYNKKFRFLGVERYIETYTEMKKVIKADKIPMKAYCGLIADKIFKMPKDSYAHIILDYCGNLSTYLDEVRYVFKKRLVKKDGYVMLTFAVNIIWDKGNHKYVKDFGRVKTNLETDNRTLCERAIENKMYNLIGENYEIMETFHYHDNKEIDGKLTKGMKMVLVVVKRIK